MFEYFGFLSHVDEEIEILKKIAEMRNDILNAIMIGITSLGNAGIFWIILALVLVCIKKTRKVGFAMAISLILSLIFTNVLIKNIVDRPRPFEYDETLKLLISRPIDSSFPSGHSSASVAAAVAIFVNNKKYGIPAIILALLIAFSRLYLSVHFPTDVLAGVILGIIYGVTAGVITKFICKKYNPEWL